MQHYDVAIIGGGIGGLKNSPKGERRQKYPQHRNGENGTGLIIFHSGTSLKAEIEERIE